MGLEPTTFELEVQHANPLRHGGYTYDYDNFYLYYITYIFFDKNLVYPSLRYPLVVLCTDQMVVPVTNMRNTIWSIKNK